MKTEKSGRKKRRLNLGCGDKIKEGWVNLDRIALDGVDVVHEMDDLPLPFPKNHFDEILCEHVLAYSNNLIALMEELWRISRPGAVITIEQPYPFNKTWSTDPMYRSPVTEHTFPKYFGDKRLSYYSKARFRQVFWHIQRNRHNPFRKENIQIKLEVVKSVPGS